MVRGDLAGGTMNSTIARQIGGRWAMTMALIMAIGAGVAEAQSTFGTMTGTVTDPSGAVVPGATVTVTNVRTQAVRTTVTAADGTYLLTNLDAGTYEITTSLSGFADGVQQF